MEFIITITFLIVCIISVFRPPWAFALVMLIFPLKQVIQALCPIVISKTMGPESVNYIVGITVVFACARITFYKNSPFANWMNYAMVATIALFAWSVISISWSPGIKDGLVLFGDRWPYFLLIIILSPLLINDIQDLNTSLRVSLYVGLLLALAFIFSSEFTSVYGRIALDLGSGYRSNSLSIGELGGTLLIFGATLRKGALPGIGIAFRLVAAVLGALLAIKAGTRGQFLAAVLVSIIFIPISAPVRNILNFVATIFTIGFVLVIASYLVSTQLEGFAAKRFSIEQILGGDSSAESRFTNLYVLFTAYLSNPISIFIGLGYNAFSALPGAAGQPYSHILFADAVCELGIPGVIFMLIAVGLGCRSTYQLINVHSQEPIKRCVLATFGALIASQILLVNKQGALWGTPILFPLLIIMVRVWLNEANTEIEESSDDIYSSSD